VSEFPTPVLLRRLLAIRSAIAVACDSVTFSASAKNDVVAASAPLFATALLVVVLLLLLLLLTTVLLVLPIFLAILLRVFQVLFNSSATAPG